MKALVLSHTLMGCEGFCSNVAGRLTATGELVQFRLRKIGNHSMKYSDLRNGEQIRREMRPGSIVKLGGLFKVHNAYQRATHPEDRILTPSRIELLHSDMDMLQKCAEELAFDHVHALFPGMSQDNGKWYRPGTEPNPRSVGYVRASSVHFYEDYYSKLRGRFTDASGQTFSCAVVGIDLREQETHPPLGPSLVRLSLANSFSHDNWRDSRHPSRCYLMLSHVIANDHAQQFPADQHPTFL